MSWDRRLDLHIDVDATTQRRLLTSESEPSILNQPPELVSGDKIKVRCYFWRRGGTAGSVDSIDPGATSTFRLSGRPQGIPSGSPVLFLATAFSEVGTGIWETTLDLNTQEMRNHIAATPAGSKLITVEIEIRDAGDTTRRSLQFEARAMPQVWDNQDAPTALPSPAAWLIGNTAPVIAARVAFSGAEEDWEGDFALAGQLDAKNFYDGENADRLRWRSSGGGKWTLEDLGQVELFYSNSAVAEPWLATDWKESGSTTVIPGFVVTNITSQAPPFFRIFDSKLYVQDGGVWKTADLSAIIP